MTCTQNVHIIKLLRHLWDPVKQRANLKKHGVQFADAAVALEDDRALTVIDDESQGEHRFKTLCVGPNPEVLMVIHTEEVEDTLTIISARLAEPAERDQYYEGDKDGHLF